MIRSIVPLFLAASDAFAHSGHGAPIVHMHEWTWYNWVAVVAMVVVPAIAIWRRK